MFAMNYGLRTLEIEHLGLLTVKNLNLVTINQ